VWGAIRGDRAPSRADPPVAAAPRLGLSTHHAHRRDPWTTLARPPGARVAETPKTRPTGANVDAFLDAVEPARRREDGRALAALIGRITGAAPEMWGPTIVGYGLRAVTYADGSVKDWLRLGFSPRKASLVLYLMDGATRRPDLLARLGKHKTGAACLYVNKLADVDEAVLAELIRASWEAP
jgi:hypothetical protein